MLPHLNNVCLLGCTDTDSKLKHEETTNSIDKGSHYTPPPH